MKKNILLIIAVVGLVIVIGLAYFLSSGVTGNVVATGNAIGPIDPSLYTDSDGGNKAETAGVVFGYEDTVASADECLGPSEVKEYYLEYKTVEDKNVCIRPGQTQLSGGGNAPCGGYNQVQVGETTFESIDCRNGAICEEVDITASHGITRAAQCKYQVDCLKDETTGTVTYTTATSSQTSVTDKCEGTVSTIYSCNADKSLNTAEKNCGTVGCQTPTKTCAGEICVPSGSSGTITNGDDPLNYGTVTLVLSASTNAPVAKDVCIDSTTLLEFYCENPGDTKISYKPVNCVALGKTCQINRCA